MSDRLQGNPNAIRELAKQLNQFGMTTNETQAKVYQALQRMDSSGDWRDRNYRKFVERFETTGRAMGKLLADYAQQVDDLQKLAQEYERLQNIGR